MHLPLYGSGAAPGSRLLNKRRSLLAGKRLRRFARNYESLGKQVPSLFVAVTPSDGASRATIFMGVFRSEGWYTVLNVC